MGLNSVSPTEFPSGVLIADSTSNAAGGSSDAITAKITPGAALDVQSTLGGFIPPRMTTIQRLALPLNDGMIVYDTTLNQLFSLENGTWNPTVSGGVVGPDVSVAGDIAIFSDTSGQIISDSGVNIANVIPPLLSIRPMGPDVTDVELSGVDILSFKDVGLIFTGTGGTSATYVCGLFPNTILGKSPNTVFGFANPSSPDAIVEMTEGAFLLPRLSQTTINALIDVDGMMVYNETTDQFNFHQDGSWVPFSTGGNPNAKYILQSADGSLPNAQSLGVLTTGLIKNTVTSSTGVLSTATAGVDYYAPNFPTILRDNGGGVLSVGIGAANGSATASNCTFMGFDSGHAITSGGNNSGFGSFSLSSTTFGVGNSAFGANAFSSNTTGDYGAILGFNAAAASINSDRVTAIGASSLSSANSAPSTTAVGYTAGSSQTSYIGCTFLGAFADASVNGLSNSCAIGTSATVAVDDALILGFGCNVGIRTDSPTAALHIIANAADIVNNGNAINFTGGMQITVTETSSNAYTVLSSDFIVNSNNTSTFTIITMPVISPHNVGKTFTVKDSGYNASAAPLYFKTTDGAKIDTATASSAIPIITGNGGSVTFYNDGTDWWVSSIYTGV